MARGMVECSQHKCECGDAPCVCWCCGLFHGPTKFHTIAAFERVWGGRPLIVPTKAFRDERIFTLWNRAIAAAKGANTAS